MKEKKKITRKKRVKKAEIEKKEEETKEKKDELPEEKTSQEESPLEFIPIEETKKQQPKKISLEDELFFQEEQLLGLDSLPSSFIEEKRKTGNNPYSPQKENPYSAKKDDRKYSASTHPRVSEIKREQIEIRRIDLSSPLTTLTIAPMQRSIPATRMPEEEEVYQQEPYQRYELEIISPDDLSRKTKEHREVKIKYDID